MINILLTGVGGQGTVLAAKLLAQAARSKGWQVRTAETIGMAQRGGSVMSHVRMGSNGEQVHSPLLARSTADLIVAFEPAEAARALPYLASHSTLVTATTPVQPVTVALSGKSYDSAGIVDALSNLLGKRLLAVDDAAITAAAGNRRVLNTALLACALSADAIPLKCDDLRDAVRQCVKPQFVDLNLKAIDLACQKSTNSTHQALHNSTR